MHFVFVMDPPSTVQVDLDTSFAIMLAAQEAGHRVSHALLEDLFVDAGRVGVRARDATMRRVESAPILLGEARDVALSDVDVVFIRKDPPFDATYLWATLLLERARGETLIVNDPRGLRDANEKLYALNFEAHMPDTLVTNDKERIKAFVARVGGRAVIKPLDGAGGLGVMQLVAGDLNTNAIIEATTRDRRTFAMVQRFLPDVVRGDKRILLLDGEPLGAILRVPRSDDVRSNIHVGGTVVATELDEADHAIVAAVAPRLRRDGLVFVGLDVIGGKLTEVNVTSPTGIQQMERLSGDALSARVVDWLVRRVESTRAV